MLALWERFRPRVRIPAFIDTLIVRYYRSRFRALYDIQRNVHTERRFFVDVSVISKHDAGTGIQRVVGALFNEMTINPPKGFVICPVAATKKRPYRYIVWRGVGDRAANGQLVKVVAGDLYFSLDFSTHAVYGNRSQIHQWKERGVEVGFFVHDLLPEHNPEWFSLASVLAYRKWIKQVAIFADFIICNSQNTREALLSHLHDRFGLTDKSIRCEAIPLGWDIRAAKFTKGLPDSIESVLCALKQRVSVLVVGTLEPRKGYDQLLSAFDLLWSGGRECNLIIVGRAGWKTEELQQRLKFHRHNGNMLYWLDNASDESLEQLYVACDGVVVASMGEGFGLPLIEALGHLKPVLARDLPIFRELGLEGVDYFSGKSEEQLANELNDWLNRLEDCQIKVGKLPAQTWRESYLAFMSACNLNFRIIES